jgi:hypothetical protein
MICTGGSKPGVLWRDGRFVRLPSNCCRLGWMPHPQHIRRLNLLARRPRLLGWSSPGAHFDRASATIWSPFATLWPRFGRPKSKEGFLRATGECVNDRGKRQSRYFGRHPDRHLSQILRAVSARVPERRAAGRCACGGRRRRPCRRSGWPACRGRCPRTHGNGVGRRRSGGRLRGRCRVRASGG